MRLAVAVVLVALAITAPAHALSGVARLPPVGDPVTQCDRSVSVSFDTDGSPPVWYAASVPTNCNPALACWVPRPSCLGSAAGASPAARRSNS